MTNGLDPTVFAAAIVTVLAAVVGGTVTVINALAAARDRRDAREERRLVIAQGASAIAESKENGKKADTIIRSTDKIHELTNSTNSNLQKELELEREKNAGLAKTITALEAEKHATAAMRAITDSQTNVALHTVPPVLDTHDTDEALQRIATAQEGMNETLEHQRRNMKSAEAGRAAFMALVKATPLSVLVSPEPLAVPNDGKS
jgi:hypothetical protein